jgi:hypothetical protein
MNTYFTRARDERPDGRPVDVVAPEPIPTHVARTLSYLAHLIDDTVTVRGEGNSVRAFAARQLGVPAEDVAIESRSLGGLDAPLVGLALADAIERFDPTVIIGEDVGEAPQWRSVDGTDVSRRYPVNVHAVFPAETFAPHGLLLGITTNWTGAEFVVYTARSHAGGARQAVEDVVAVGRELTNPFRGRVLTVTVDGGSAPQVQIAPVAPLTRADLIFPEEMWDEIDLNVKGMFAALESFEAAGLSTNRGVLLHGPPGTGKTALIRVLANELAGDVTVLLADSESLENAPMLYEIAGAMSPAIVVLEDLERVVTGHGGAGRDLLNTLDGAASGHRAIVTIATANEPRRFDPALLRSSRFDAKIEVLLPSAQCREAIMSRYLEGTDLDIDPAPIATAARGASGADLKELVSAAILQQGSGVEVTTELIVAEVRKRFDEPSAGQYL